MCNTEDKLIPNERACVEQWRKDTSTFPVVALLEIIDRLAPKPVEYVSGIVALQDMLSRVNAVYRQGCYEFTSSAGGDILERPLSEGLSKAWNLTPINLNTFLQYRLVKVA